jgi:hypothetical protein
MVRLERLSEKKKSMTPTPGVKLTDFRFVE